MRNFFMALIVTVIVSIAKCYAQDVQDPGGYGTFEIGWSSDGNGALDLMFNEIGSKLTQLGIPTKSPLIANPLNPFPFITDGNEVAIEIREKNTGDYYSAYEIFAISNPLGEKSIFTFNGPQENTDGIDILGFSVNPLKSRMAVFIYSNEGGYGGHIIGKMYVSGCHLTSGFVKTAK